MDTYVCAIHTCPNSVKTEHTICDACMYAHKTTLAWLTRHAIDLEYKLNPAYKSGNTNSGSTSTPPDAVRETYAEILYGEDNHGNLGIQPTIRVWLTCLSQPYRTVDSITTLTKRLAAVEDIKLSTHGSSSVYMPMLTHATHKARTVLNNTNTCNILWGACPNPACGQPLQASETAETINCRNCKCKWTRGYLRQQQAQRILASPMSGTQTQLIAILNAQGIHVNAATVRKWVERGQLTPAGVKGRRKTYRLANIYQLATRQ